MRIKAICPKNKKHNKFIITTIQIHDWIVNEFGERVKDLGYSDISVAPDSNNVWTCKVCGANAKFIEVED